MTRFIALTDFGREKMIEAGLSREKIAVKPNFVGAAPQFPGSGAGGYVLFVGRLSPEKGIETLLRAWATDSHLPKLRVIGDGPMRAQVLSCAAHNAAVEYLGSKPSEVVLQQMSNAAFLVFPSESYEGMGMVIAEAFACGTPVIASRMGAHSTLITENETGFFFEAGNAEALRNTVRAAMAGAADPQHMRRMARAEFERGYAPEMNYSKLMSIYREALTTPGPLKAASQVR